MFNFEYFRKGGIIYLPLIIFFLSAHVSGEGKPNVILVMADDMGWAQTGYSSKPPERSERLARLEAPCSCRLLADDDLARLNIDLSGGPWEHVYGGSVFNQEALVEENDALPESVHERSVMGGDDHGGAALLNVHEHLHDVD